MWQLAGGLLLFFGMHSVSIFARGFRDRMAVRSEWGWKAAYSLVSVAGLVLMIRGYGEMRTLPTVLYTPPVWLHYVAAVLLLPVFTLLFAPYFPGRIRNAIKNPQLAAVKLWALAHLLANGTLADVLLFGSFLAWAVADVISMKHRAARPVPSLPGTKLNDAVLVVLGLGIYAVFVFWLHRAWFGVAPLGWLLI